MLFQKKKSKSSRRPVSSKRQASLSLERLETRDAPATLVGATKVTYQDVDGDNVTVTLSKPLLTPGNVNNVFKFNTGTVSGSNTTKQQLQRIDLTVIGAPAIGTGISTVATVSNVNGGDGFANLGIISADELGLGAIRIDGDLGRIDAGDSSTLKQAIGSLTVQSWGRFGITTQPAGGDLHSSIYGHVGPVQVKGDVVGAFVDCSGIEGGKIASIFIGGSLIGGATSEAGAIVAVGDIGPVVIKGDVVGNTGTFSAQISSGNNGKLASVTIGGSLIGGAGNESGTIHMDGDIGSVTVRGGIIGGGGFNSGAVIADKRLAGVQVGSSVMGGAGQESGEIFAAESIGTVRINGDLVGGSFSSGRVFAGTSLASLTIGGSVFGGTGTDSGRVDVEGKLGSLSIRGSVIGGAGERSGNVLGGLGIASATIGGSVIGGDGVNSGVVNTFNALLGAIRIGGDVRGGAGRNSGRVSSDRDIASVTVGGSLIGGGGDFSGTIIATEKLGSVRINGELLGGSGASSGFIDGEKLVTSVSVGGSIRSGIGLESGGIGSPNGSIGSVTIGAGIVGTASHPVFIFARGQVAPVGTTDLAIAGVNVRGGVEFARILGGYASSIDKVNADAQIGTVAVGGDWIASSIAAGADPNTGNNFGDLNDIKIAGSGVKDEAAVFSRIQSVVIGGQALGTLAGADGFGIVAENVGAVKIGGTPLLLALGNGNDDILVGATFDFKVNEI